MSRLFFYKKPPREKTLTCRALIALFIICGWPFPGNTTVQGPLTLVDSEGKSRLAAVRAQRKQTLKIPSESSNFGIQLLESSPALSGEKTPTFQTFMKREYPDLFLLENEEAASFISKASESFGSFCRVIEDLDNLAHALTPGMKNCIEDPFLFEGLSMEVVQCLTEIGTIKRDSIAREEMPDFFKKLSFEEVKSLVESDVLKRKLIQSEIPDLFKKVSLGAVQCLVQLNLWGIRNNLDHNIRFLGINIESFDKLSSQPVPGVKESYFIEDMKKCVQEEQKGKEFNNFLEQLLEKAELFTETLDEIEKRVIDLKSFLKGRETESEENLTLDKTLIEQEALKRLIYQYLGGAGDELLDEKLDFLLLMLFVCKKIRELPTSPIVEEIFDKANKETNTINNLLHYALDKCCFLSQDVIAVLKKLDKNPTGNLEILIWNGNGAVVKNDTDEASDLENKAIDDPNIDDPNIDDPNIDDPNIDDPNIDDPNIDDPNIDEQIIRAIADQRKKAIDDPIKKAINSLIKQEPLDEQTKRVIANQVKQKIEDSIKKAINFFIKQGPLDAQTKQVIANQVKQKIEDSIKKAINSFIKQAIDDPNVDEQITQAIADLKYEIDDPIKQAINYLIKEIDGPIKEEINYLIKEIDGPIRKVIGDSKKKYIDFQIKKAVFGNFEAFKMVSKIAASGKHLHQQYAFNEIMGLINDRFKNSVSADEGGLVSARGDGWARYRIRSVRGLSSLDEEIHDDILEWCVNTLLERELSRENLQKLVGIIERLLTPYFATGSNSMNHAKGVEESSYIIYPIIRDGMRKIVSDTSHPFHKEIYEILLNTLKNENIGGWTKDAILEDLFVIFISRIFKLANSFKNQPKSENVFHILKEEINNSDSFVTQFDPQQNLKISKNNDDLEEKKESIIGSTGEKEYPALSSSNLSEHYTFASAAHGYDSVSSRKKQASLHSTFDLDSFSPKPENFIFKFPSDIRKKEGRKQESSESKKTSSYSFVSKSKVYLDEENIILKSFSLDIDLKTNLLFSMFICIFMLSFSFYPYTNLFPTIRRPIYSSYFSDFILN